MRVTSIRIVRGALACVVFSIAMAPSPDFRVSLSVSPFTESVLAAGTSYTDGTVTATTTEELQRLFVRHGANEVYARVGTRQTYRGGAGDHSMNRALDRARLAAALHLPLNPELGLFAVYGDIRCQPQPDFSDYPAIRLPAFWASLTLDQMLAALRDYGAAAARQIVGTGAQVRIWDLGNEIEFGVAGVSVRPMRDGCDASGGAATEYHAPDLIDRAIGTMSFETLAQMRESQRIAWLEAHVWPHEAKMLAAVASGIRSVDAQARFSTHVSGIASTQPALAVAFFKAMKFGGFSADECGASYYPTASSAPRDRLAAFKEMAEAVHRELGCPLFVAEFGYPAATMSGVFSWNAAVDGYPLTPDGQARFVRDLVAWGARNGVLSGIRPWAPDLVLPGWGPMSLFERRGRVVTARPVLDAFTPKP
jgi:hypothetical protein